jgi:hypothetical protein
MLWGVVKPMLLSLGEMREAGRAGPPLTHRCRDGGT